MSYDEEGGNEFANGGNNRFDGIADRYKAGGHPCHISAERAEELKAAMAIVLGYYKRTLSSELLDADGKLAADLPTKDLIREFKAAKDFKEAADLIEKEAGRVYDFMRLAAIPNRFDEDGINSIKVEGVGRVQLAGDLYAGIIKGREAEAFEWLGDNGRGDLVKQTVNSSSIKAVLKKMLTEGEEYPAELFKAEPFTRASIVKA